ncbi:MAG: hypothetical protein CVU45_07385, partial [Chloroflexi bacterium HGW-Chloroflexi-7]
MRQFPGFLYKLVGSILIILLAGCSFPSRTVVTPALTSAPLVSETPPPVIPEPPLAISICSVESECPPVVLLDDMIGRVVEAGT